MADFKVHLSGGLMLGSACAAAALAAGLVGGVAAAVGLIFVPAAIGSVAPDIDSDSSVPFTVSFGALSVMAALLAGIIAWEATSGAAASTAVAALASGGLVWFVVGYIFKRFTRHRGMVHSVPAAVLSALLGFLLSGRLGLSDWSGFVLGFSFGLGYLLHLVLDEAYATVDFEGRKIGPKKSLGSAMKFTSSRPRVTALVYSLIVGILAVNYGRFAPLVHKAMGIIA